jgi:predicted regulator of Ras-like GTPase activity (Roadblock/LC7/MglB family)
MRLTTLWRTVKGSQRAPTRVEMFRAASRERDAGRFDVALDLVTRGLATAPNSVVGHLLAGNLHLATRAMTPARDAFERVLQLDAHQPRALLGLARVAFEEHDGTACRTFLERAIARYPDFPEAQALLDVLTTPTGSTPSTLTGRGLVLPTAARALVLVGADGAVIAGLPEAENDSDAAHVHRVTRLATAILERAGLGRLRDAVIQEGPQTILCRASESATLAVSFPSEVDFGTATTEVDRVWTTAHADASVEVAPA